MSPRKGHASNSEASVPMQRARFQRIAKALADPRRFEIFELIASGEEVACQRVFEGLPVSQATVSHHLRELANAELVSCRREGQFAYLTARSDVVKEYVTELQRRLGIARSTRRRS